MTHQLHSQSPDGEYGRPLNYQGDLYQVGQPYAELLTSIKQRLAEEFPEAKIKVSGTNKTGMRRFVASVVSAPGIDFTDEKARAEFLTKVADQIWRFGFDNSNPIADDFSRSFSVDTEVAEEWWAERQRQIGADLIEDKMSLAQFKNELTPGHFFQDDTSRYVVEAVASRIVVYNEDNPCRRLHWDFPISKGFLCDGTKVRFARGSKNDPDAYDLYHWVRP